MPGWRSAASQLAALAVAGGSISAGVISKAIMQPLASAGVAIAWRRGLWLWLASNRRISSSGWRSQLGSWLSGLALWQRRYAAGANATGAKR